MQFPEIREEVEEEAVTPLVTNINSFTRFVLEHDIIIVVIFVIILICRKTSLLLGICKQSYSN